LLASPIRGDLAVACRGMVFPLRVHREPPRERPEIELWAHGGPTTPPTRLSENPIVQQAALDFAKPLALALGHGRWRSNIAFREHRPSLTQSTPFCMELLENTSLSIHYAMNEIFTLFCYRMSDASFIHGVEAWVVTHHLRCTMLNRL